MNNWKEIDLFNYLVENIYPDLVESKNKMSRWDCYSQSKKHRIELKCRKVHYETLLLEKKKFDAMINECKNNLDTPIYINSTPQGIFIFNLNLIEQNWESNSINPATTNFTNNEKIEKQVTYLNINKSKQLKTMELNVKIHSISETVNVSDTFQKREFVVETQEDYKQYLLLQVVKDKCNVLNGFKVGQLVNVSINLKGRLWSDKSGVEKCFNTLECWKITAQANVQATVQVAGQPFETVTELNDAQNDLPF